MNDQANCYRAVARYLDSEFRPGSRTACLDGADHISLAESMRASAHVAPNGLDIFQKSPLNSMDLLPQVRHLKSPSHAKPALSIGPGDIERLQAAPRVRAKPATGPAFGRLRRARRLIFVASPMGRRFSQRETVVRRPLYGAFITPPSSTAPVRVTAPWCGRRAASHAAGRDRDRPPASCKA